MPALVLAVALSIAMLATPGIAHADSGGATIRTLPESEQLQELPTVFGVRPSPGYRACQRVALPNATVEELDAMVERAGGETVRVSMASKGLRAGRLVAPVYETSYYLIPNDVFDA